MRLGFLGLKCITLSLDAFKSKACSGVLARRESRFNTLERYRRFRSIGRNKRETLVHLHHGSSRVHCGDQTPSKSAGFTQPFNGFNMGKEMAGSRLGQVLQRLPSRPDSSKRCGRAQRPEMVLSGRCQSLEKGRIRPSNGPLKGTPLAVQAPDFGCTFLHFATENQHIAEQPERLDEVDLIGDFTSALCPKLPNQVSGHDLRDLLPPVSEITLELDEDLPSIAHPKHDARS